MALTRPSLPENTIMDSEYDKIITFEAFGGTQFTGYDVEIYDNDSNILFFSMSKSNTSSNKINIEANTLKNGVTYRIRVRTFDGNGDYSDWSDYGLIVCYTTPVCTIDNIEIVGENRVVANQNYIFVGSYQQNEGIEIQKYQYILYDNDQNVVQEFSEVSSLFIDDYKNLSQRVDGFAPSTQYYIELKCTDKNGLEVSSGLIHFNVEYEAPRIKQIVTLENESETASVKISSDMIQIIFKMDGENEVPIYINEQELDLRGTGAYVDKYVNIPMNFTLKIYCRAIPSVDIGDKDYFLTITSSNGLAKIEMKESGNRIHVYKTVTPKPSGADLVSHYVSNEIENYVPEQSYIVIQINHFNRRIDVFAEVTEMVA